MLTKPKYGWTSIKIKDFECRASYLTWVPIDCLEAMIRAIEERLDFLCTFDAEGWEFKVISDDYRTYIINEAEYPSKLTQIEDIDKFDLAKELIDDIESNIEDWYDFPGFHIPENEDDEFDDTEDYNKYKKELDSLLEKLKKLINKV